MNIRIPLCFMIFLTGCSLLPGHAENDLKGSWDWVLSQGGFGGWKLTPESEGFSKTLIINDGQYYTITKNGEPVEEGTYEIKLLEFDGSVRPAIKFESGFTESFILQSDDTLRLLDTCFDCYYHVYVRSK